MMRYIFALMIMTVGLAGCKYYGSALPPEYPMSMDDSLSVAEDNVSSAGGARRPIIQRMTRPRVEQPSYIPEKELAMVAPPRTLLVWTYPHVTDTNQRVFGNWSTIFLTDRYEWVPPSNMVPVEEQLQMPLGFPAATP